MTTQKLHWVLLLLTLGIWSCNPEDEEEFEEEMEQNMQPPASNFCYNLTIDSWEYEELQNPNEVVLFDDFNDDDVYEIDLGFDFAFCGEIFNKIYIAQTYWITFNYSNTSGFTDFTGYELMPLGNYELDPVWDDVGFSGYLSKIFYQTSGEPGNRKFVLEFRDWDFEDGLDAAGMEVNFQIELYESDNSIVYHYGDLEAEIFDNFSILKVGLYPELGQEGLFLCGDESQPTQTTFITTSSGELNSFPSDNRVYHFQN